MSFEAYRDKEIKYYQDRINQLEQENSLLKNHSCFQHQQPIQHQMDPYANSIYCNFLLIQSLQQKMKNWNVKQKHIKDK